MADHIYRIKNGLTVNNGLLFANNGKVSVNSAALGVTFGVAANDGIQLPTGNTGQRVFTAGVLRFNSETLLFEGAINSTAYTAFSGVSGITYTGGSPDIVTITAGIFVGGTGNSRFGNSTVNTNITNGQILVSNSTQNSVLTPGAVSYANSTAFTNVSVLGYVGAKVTSLDLQVNTTVLVTNGGSVGVGNNTPADKLHVQGNIVATGDVTTAFSDERLKKNIVRITNALTIVEGLGGYFYVPNKKAEKTGYSDTSRSIGVLAQEVEKVLPELVKVAAFDRGEVPMAKDGVRYKTVVYDRFIPVLIEAIKELKVEIDELKRGRNDGKGQCECSCR